MWLTLVLYLFWVCFKQTKNFTIWEFSELPSISESGLCQMGFCFFFNTWRHMLLSMMQYFGNSGQTNRRCVIRHQNSGWLELGLESVIINININKQFGYVSHMGFKILELHTLALNTIQQVVILNSFFNRFCPPKMPF